MRYRPWFSLALLALVLVTSDVFAQCTQSPGASGRDSVLLQPGRIIKGRDYPLLVYLHGYGDNARNASTSLVQLARRANLFILCVSASGPQVQRGCQNGPQGHEGYQWVLPVDENRILSSIARVKEQRSIGEVYLSGFSQGGHLTYYVGLRHPDLFHGIIPISGAVPWLGNMNIEKPYGDKAGSLPIYVIHGKQDTGIAFAQAEKAMEHFRANGLSIAIHAWNGGHSFPPDYEKRFREGIRFIRKCRARTARGS